MFSAGVSVWGNHPAHAISQDLIGPLQYTRSLLLSVDARRRWESCGRRCMKRIAHRQQKDYIASLSVVSSHILHISLFSAHNITWRAVMLCIRNVGDLCSQYSKYAFRFTCFVFCIDEGIITRVRWLRQSCWHRNVVSCKDDACIGMWCGFMKRCIWSKTRLCESCFCSVWRQTEEACQEKVCVPPKY